MYIVDTITDPCIQFLIDILDVFIWLNTMIRTIL